MDMLSAIEALWDFNVDLIPHHPYVEPKPKSRVFIQPEVKEITLADQDMRSKDFVTAHDLRDYRRTEFAMVLLPNIELPYDVIAHEVYGL